MDIEKGHDLKTLFECFSYLLCFDHCSWMGTLKAGVILKGGSTIADLKQENSDEKLNIFQIMNTMRVIISERRHRSGRARACLFL